MSDWGNAAQNFAEWVLGIYLGLPWWAVPIFWLAAVVVLSSAASLTILIIRAQIAIRQVERTRGRHGMTAAHAREAQSDYLWVFFVPALNEEVTIADSVGRLREVEVDHKRILVINDGSDDRTGEILAEMDHTDLVVLTRVRPEARQGKSEALNDAWRYLTRTVLAEGEYAGWDPRKVIVAIVDADGRIDRKAGHVARHFEVENVGGVQSLVRIYNRQGFLTWAQNLEFAVFGFVYQMGRVGWGTANMGGNGQFNRLAALNDVVLVGSSGKPGPWREGRLTEDQDIGLRLISKGWLGRQSTRVTIDQQGLNSLRALYRQRTRWAQGGWQMLDFTPSLIRNSNLGFTAKWDQFWYLMTPVLQAFVGATVVLSITLLVTGIVDVIWTVPIIVLIYVFSIAPGVAGVLFADRALNPLRVLVNILTAHGYAIYALLIFPVVYRALWRHLRGSTSWAKTRREALTPAE